VDRQRLSQVVENLISNAIYFSAERGTVSVELQGSTPRDGEPGVTSCRVRDRGPGISEADLPRLFEPFFTRRSGGTGLGLSIVRRIVQEHGGEVTAENHPEGGAILTLRLPTGARGEERP
jgi:signal transduction histidine kinase